MSNTDDNSKTDAPDGRAALRDYWSVYSKHYDLIMAETMRIVVAHPVFGPVIAAIPKEALDAQNAKSRALTEAAIEGAWEPYERDLREQGAVYAAMGVSFDAWYDIVRAYQRVIVPLVV